MGTSGRESAGSNRAEQQPKGSVAADERRLSMQDLAAAQHPSLDANVNAKSHAAHSGRPASKAKRNSTSSAARSLEATTWRGDDSSTNSPTNFTPFARTRGSPETKSGKPVVRVNTAS